MMVSQSIQTIQSGRYISVILLQIVTVMVCPGTHLVKNHESQLKLK